MDAVSNSSDDTVMSPLSTAQRNVSSYQRGFRKTYLFYLKKNGSPKILFKLMQTCKFFWFKKFPFMVIEDFKYNYDFHIYREKNQRAHVLLHLENVTKPLWITNMFTCHGSLNLKLVSQILTKTATCDLKALELYHQILTVSDFKMLVSSGNIVNFLFYHSHVEHGDGRIFRVDEIVKMLPNVKRFDCLCGEQIASTITFETTKKLIENLNPAILQYFLLKNIPKTFNFVLFAAFMNKNQKIKFILKFNEEISETYARMLQNYVKKLTESPSFKNRRILIHFTQQNQEHAKILYHQFYNYY